VEWFKEMSDEEFEDVKASFSELDHKIFKKKLEEYWVITAPTKSKGFVIKQIIDNSVNNSFWPLLLEAFPSKPTRNVCYYYRSVLLYYQSQETPWTKQDIERLKKLERMFPNQWKRIGIEITREPQHCKNTMATIKKLKQNPWSNQEEKKFLDFIYFYYGKNVTISVHDLPYKKIQKIFPDKPLDCIILKWQVDLWPKVYERMITTAQWDRKDTEYLLIKIALQKPNTLGDIDFSRVSKMWENKTIQQQLSTLLKSIPGGYVLPLQIALSSLLNDYRLDVNSIKANKKKDDFKAW